jgi:hypothetical protein
MFNIHTNTTDDSAAQQAVTHCNNKADGLTRLVEDVEVDEILEMLAVCIQSSVHTQLKQLQAGNNRSRRNSGDSNALNNNTGSNSNSNNNSNNNSNTKATMLMDIDMYDNDVIIAALNKSHSMEFPAPTPTRLHTHSHQHHHNHHKHTEQHPNSRASINNSPALEIHASGLVENVSMITDDGVDADNLDNSTDNLLVNLANKQQENEQADNDNNNNGDDAKLVVNPDNGADEGEDGGVYAEDSIITIAVEPYTYVPADAKADADADKQLVPAAAGSNGNEELLSVLVVFFKQSVEVFGKMFVRKIVLTADVEMDLIERLVFNIVDLFAYTSVNNTANGTDNNSVSSNPINNPNAGIYNKLGYLDDATPAQLLRADSETDEKNSKNSKNSGVNSNTSANPPSINLSAVSSTKNYSTKFKAISARDPRLAAQMSARVSARMPGSKVSARMSARMSSRAAAAAAAIATGRATVGGDTARSAKSEGFYSYNYFSSYSARMSQVSPGKNASSDNINLAASSHSLNWPFLTSLPDATLPSLDYSLASSPKNIDSFDVLDQTASTKNNTSFDVLDSSNPDGNIEYIGESNDNYDDHGDDEDDVDMMDLVREDVKSFMMTQVHSAQSVLSHYEDKLRYLKGQFMDNFAMGGPNADMKSISSKGSKGTQNTSHNAANHYEEAMTYLEAVTSSLFKSIVSLYTKMFKTMKQSFLHCVVSSGSNNNDEFLDLLNEDTMTKLTADCKSKMNLWDKYKNALHIMLVDFLIRFANDIPASLADEVRNHLKFVMG